MMTHFPDCEGGGSVFERNAEYIAHHDEVKNVCQWDEHESKNEHYHQNRINTQFSKDFGVTQSSVTAGSSERCSPHSTGTQASTVVHANDGGCSANPYNYPWQGHHTSYHHGYHAMAPDCHPHPHSYHANWHHGYTHGHTATTSEPGVHSQHSAHGPGFAGLSYEATWQDYHGAPETIVALRLERHMNDSAVCPADGYKHHDPQPRMFYPVPDEMADSRDDDQSEFDTGGPLTAPYIGEYNDTDILCGRGALMVWHPGNQVFRQLVQNHRQRYFFSRRQEKKNIASQIIHEIRARGGRFLRRTQASDGLNQINVWVEIDNERAYQKTCQALREGAPDIRKQYRIESSRQMPKGQEAQEEARVETGDDAASE